jgi:hypothetical protein
MLTDWNPALGGKSWAALWTETFDRGSVYSQHPKCLMEMKSCNILLIGTCSRAVGQMDSDRTAVLTIQTRAGLEEGIIVRLEPCSPDTATPIRAMTPHFRMKLWRYRRQNDAFSPESQICHFERMIMASLVVKGVQFGSTNGPPRK